MQIIFNGLFISLILVRAFSAGEAFASRQAGTDMFAVFQETPPSGMPATAFPNAAEFRRVDWAQPPLGCVEEMAPHRADRPCPNLASVANPQKDWPSNLSPADKQYWYSQRRGINVCRSEEILRREKASPGSMNASMIELAWMAIDSLRNREVKVAAIYEASRTYGVPLQVLTGAVYQESLFSELGIADDGGNYSCGVGQINLIGWCEWANKQGADVKQAMGWPQQAVPCNNSNYVQLSLFKPIYRIALTRLGGKPSYRLMKEHFANIPLSSFVNQWPSASPEVQEYRYQLIRSYIENCSDARKGILAKSNDLSGIYNQYITPALKNKDRFAQGGHFNRECWESQAGSNAYPLHTGWLLAVAAYNAGPRAVDAAAHYNEWTKSAMNDSRLVELFKPTDIVTSLYWGGKYNPGNDLIEFNSLAGGSEKSWTWFKGCVAQRHVARVMQHVTLLPNFFVDSLENGVPCARSAFAGNGRLLQTAVPPARQISSGVK